MNARKGSIVVDIGAARYGGDYSMERLIERFAPRLLFGIDPNPALELPLLTFPRGHAPAEEARVELIHAAAWLYDGIIGFRPDGLNSWITPNHSGTTSPCIDLSRFLTEVSKRERKDGEGIVLKLDCEGAEYSLLPELILHEVDDLLSLVIVEWHPKNVPGADQMRREIEKTLGCEVEEWSY